MSNVHEPMAFCERVRQFGNILLRRISFWIVDSSSILRDPHLRGNVTTMPVEMEATLVCFGRFFHNVASFDGTPLAARRAYNSLHRRIPEGAAAAPNVTKFQQ